MSGRTFLALAAAALLAGCTPTAARQVPVSPGGAKGEPAPARDCRRQFDDNDAGFQTCGDGGEEASRAP